MTRIPRSLFVPMAFLCATIGCAQGGPLDTTLIFSLQGTVYDKQNVMPIKAAQVSVVGTDGTSFSAIADENGGFGFAENATGRYIKPNNTYVILVEKEGYLVIKDRFTTVGLNENTSFVKEYFLVRHTICRGPLPALQFSRNSALIQEVVDPVLPKVFRILEDNPTISLEIVSHTDQSERPELSMHRGKNVKDALTAKGINPGRLHISSKESSDPRITSEQIEKMLDENERQNARSVNQRVEFRVLDYNWKP